MSATKINILDTTLRDGEQCPGASMTADEKLLIAKMLDLAEVDIIEAGFPASSPGDLNAVKQISSAVKNSTVCALSRCKKDDIDKAYEALKNAKKSRVHLFISTSPLHMKHKINMEPAEVLESIKACVSYAKEKFPEVQWSCEDGTRSDRDFLYECFQAAVDAGADIVNIADTVGYVLPHELSDLVKSILSNVTGIDKKVFSVHCHNDLGNAVSNSLASILAGARQVECTINGIGERAGNAALEEVVMTLKTRQDLGFSSTVHTKLLSSISKLVSDITGFVVPPNKAIVGSNIFAHESGIHQHGILKHRGTYEIMNPEDIGAEKTKLVIGKHSGRHAMLHLLQRSGYKNVTVNQLDDIFIKFKTLAEKDKNIGERTLLEIAESILAQKKKLHSAA